MIDPPKIPCNFDTDRLIVIPLNEMVDLDALALRTITILTPEVTQALPPGWQNIDSKENALHWIQERAAESTFLLVKSKPDDIVIGFIFLYSEDEGDASEIRFGYLFGKESWGKGLGTEVLRGFLDWAKRSGTVRSVSGGVEKSNIGSIKVLEKVGFIAGESTPDTIFYEYKIDR